MTTWHKGPPPSIGWWLASTRRNPNILRWWNGKWWSIPAYSDMSAESAANFAKSKTGMSDIEWAERPASWPERSKT